MNVLSAILPVFLMIGTGYVCQKKQVLSENEVNGLSNVINKIFFPVMIFNAIFTTSLQVEMLGVIAFMFCVHLIAIGIGKITSSFTSKEHSNVSPYLMATVDGGNICYPLYATIVGSQYIGNVVLLDFACMFIVFLVIPVLVSMQNQNNTDVKSLFKNLIKDPLIITLGLAIILQLCGVYSLLETTGFLSVYESVISMVTSPIVTCILFTIGYRFHIEKSSIGSLIKCILVRVGIMTIFATLFFLVFPTLVQDTAMKVVVPLYFLSLPALVLTSQLESLCKKKEDQHFLSAFISLYFIVALLVYMVLAVMFA